MFYFNGFMSLQTKIEMCVESLPIMTEYIKKIWHIHMHVLNVYKLSINYRKGYICINILYLHSFYNHVL